MAGGHARRVTVAAVAAVGIVGLLLACGSTGGDDSGGVRVVASTDVYGDIARRIGGDRVGVTSVISDPSQDPHSYEADARTQLALSRADVVIENGGGYDDFVGRMISASDAHPVVIDAVRVSGRTAPAHGELNEHVWYDLPSVHRLVVRLVRVLSAADPDGAAGFRARAARFTAGLGALERTEAAIRHGHAGAGVAITEPVPLYLLRACGFVNRTPPEFTAAIEEGDDASVRAVDRTLALFDEHRVVLLAYNEQSSGVQTARVRAAARANHIPVVPVTETLPAGQDYLAWMRGNLDAIEAAVA